MATQTVGAGSKAKKAAKVKTAEQLAVEQLKKTDPTKWRAVKLRELAARRVPAAIKRIKHCANLSAYKPTEEQAVAICDALQAAVNSMRMRLRGERDAQKQFDLP